MMCKGTTLTLPLTLHLPEVTPRLWSAPRYVARALTTMLNIVAVLWGDLRRFGGLPRGPVFDLCVHILCTVWLWPTVIVHTKDLTLVFGMQSGFTMKWHLILKYYLHRVYRSWDVNAKVRFRSQFSLCKYNSGKSDTETVLSLNISVSSCQNHSTSTPRSTSS